ncbi:MAG: PriCT-2 domain-containing protein, partial [Gemmatimonadaceae bacterium]|nr:PriCT-2 domain-containing protein [Gemmatimonadaceae bacterium]
MDRRPETLDPSTLRRRIEDALACLPADDRDLWVRIAMAVKAALGEDGFDLWDTWSRRSERYRAPDALTTWRSIHPDGGVTIGTLFFEAREHGDCSSKTAATAFSEQSSIGPADAGSAATNAKAPAPGGGAADPPAQHCNGATVISYAAFKQLPEDFLRSLGLTDIHYRNAPAMRIPYRDAGGVEVAVRIRCALERPDTHDVRFAWRRGDKPQLYGLDRLRSTNVAVLVEGESDCHTLWYHGFAALGIPGAGAWNEARDAAHLNGIATVYVVVEPDQGGETVKQWLAKSALRDRAWLVDLAPFKDVSALHCSDPGAFAQRFRAALDRAVPMSQCLAAASARSAADAWAACESLAKQPRILDAVADAYRAAGAVGEARTAMTLYLALTSRFLSRPVSLAVKGPSSGGKSFTVETVLRLFPPEAVHCVTALSDRALAYMDADLRHRFLVVFEAAGMGGEFASYLIRSLLSEGRLIYEFVEKTSTGMRPRRIEKQGPTGLIVTTTAVRLHPENETRLLSLTVTDTPEQTRAVMRAMARPSMNELDVTPWVALQTWLAHAEHRAVIPFASELAERIAPVAVRLRRDFGQLLNLIRAHAILHQATREHDADGRIVATLDDYAVVRDLVLDVISQGIEAAVAPIVRETVETVRALIA